MKKYKILAIDESGKASYNHKSPLFILTGVIIPENFRSKLDGKIRKIKKKYFDDEDIVFHGRDMARKKGPFSILNDSKKEICFWGEFVSIIDVDIQIADALAPIAGFLFKNKKIINDKIVLMKERLINRKLKEESIVEELKIL